jgi:hypothetical protein
VRHPYGHGLAVYLPWQPGRQFHRHGQLNTFNFLVDTLEHQAGFDPLGGNLPSQVSVSLHQNALGAVLLHLVNASGHFGNTYYPPISIHNLQLTIPWTKSPPKVARALYSRQDIPFEHTNGRLKLGLPSLGLFEALYLG